jgi:hypothetical protein
MSRPTMLFVDITIRSDRGRKADLKPYFEAANHAVMQLAINKRVFCGVVGRRAVVSERTLTRHMRRHGFYGRTR